MDIKKIDHLGIVVSDLEEGICLFRDGLKLPYLRTEDLPDWNIRIAFFQCGEVLLELIEPVGPCDGLTFLQNQGGGLHHIAFEVEDIHDAFEKARGAFETKTSAPVIGAGNSEIFFLQEKTILNMQTEFVELKKGGK